MTYYPPPVQPPLTQPGPPFMPPQRRPREVSILRAILTAPLFSRKTYRDVAQNWRGVGFLYIFLLILPQIVFSVRAHYFVQNWTMKELPRFIVDFPTITVSGGVASSPAEQPYTWKTPEGDALLALDTTGQWNSIDDVTAPMLVTKTMFYIRGADGRIQAHSMKEIPPGTYDSAKLQQFADAVAGRTGYILAPVGVVASWVWHIIVALILGAFAMVFASIFHARITYAQGLRISAVAMTTGLILNVLIWVFWIDIPWCKTLIGLINLGYVLYGVAVGLDRGPSFPAPGFYPQAMMPPAGYQGQAGMVPLPAPPP